MIRRRCRGFSRPAATASSTAASITPSPRCRSSSPSRTRSGSHASARTVPSRRTAAGAVTTGRQNTASSPAAGAVPPAVTVPPPQISRSAARTTTVPAGVPVTGDSGARLASTTSGTRQCTRAPGEGTGFDTHTLTRSPSLPRVPANPRVRDGELRGIQAVWADPAPGFVQTPANAVVPPPGPGSRRGPSRPRRPMIRSRTDRSRAPCGCRSAIAARPLTCPSARRTGSHRGQGGKRGRRCRSGRATARVHQDCKTISSGDDPSCSLKLPQQRDRPC